LISEAVEAARIRKARRDSPTGELSPAECIGKALRDHRGRVVVSWSGGKCSTAVLHMTLQADPEIPVVFNDTGVEFPETYNFIRTVSKDWNLNLEIIKPLSGQDFWTCVETYGFPMLRGQYSTKSKDGKPICCQWLKEDPFQRFLKSKDFEATITGLRASESRMRTFGIAQFGQHYYAKTLKHWRYHPIAFWTRENLDSYTRFHQLPVNNIYEMGHERCGCWPCTGYIGWRESLAKSHPKMYKFLAKKRGEPTLWEFQDPPGCAPIPKTIPLANLEAWL